MSTSTASSTRSSSPATSATSDFLPDEIAPFQSVDFSAWCNPQAFSPDSDTAPWNFQDLAFEPKLEDNNLMMMDDTVHDRSYEPITPDSDSPIAINPAVFQLSQPLPEPKTSLNTNVFSNFSSDASSCESAAIPDLMSRATSTTASATKVVPPPPVQPRRVDNAASHRIIYPAKETCYNLAILTPNIPPSGTKSRVETQVRVALDLALASGSSGDPLNYDKVGSWKWLKLPKGTATRKRSRKEGKIDASPNDTLYLDVEVTCASDPTRQVSSCSTCQGREAKRVARKIAARVRPARSDSESNDGPSPGEGAPSGSVIQFNCPDTLDFTGGSVVLPLRITCYCRHHREKVGFNVNFTMKDDSGRIIGKGVSPPIMITDDHKSTDKSSSKNIHLPSYLADADWESRAPQIPSAALESAAADTGAPSKRRQSGSKDATGPSKKRAKPYDTGRPESGRARRGESTEGNPYPTVIPAASTSTQGNPYPDVSALIQYASAESSAYSGTAPPSPSPQESECLSALTSPSDAFASPTSISSSILESHDAMMRETLVQTGPFFPLSPPYTAPSSPPMNDGLPSALSPSRAELDAFTFSFLEPRVEPSSVPSLPAPKIHRLIPSTGPTYGGIEVTVLGSNFHPSVMYNCIFGDVVASSTSRWSDNTLVCVLPPRACAGVVPVALENIKLDAEPASEPVLFTYTDESDRTLMELALQVVGLKMTGKIEDAKDIAMRIVGSSGQESQSQSSNMDVNQIINLATGALPDARRLLLGRTDDAEFEKIIMDSLSVLNMRHSSDRAASLTQAISHQTKTGQTLLHLASFLNFPSLVEFLIQLEIDLDAQDVNGCTALHFAALSGSQCCARLIINASADIAVVDKLGRSAVELAPAGFFGPLLTHAYLSGGSRGSQSGESDDESNFGDVEDDSGDEAHSRVSHASKRRIRHSRSRRSSKPASIADDASDVEEPPDYDAAADDDDNATVVSPDSPPMPDSPGKDTTMDEKQAASFAEFFQRAWAQFQPPHLMPQMPHMQMPQLPGMPAWVLPVFVPMPAMPAWPPFRGEKHDGKGKTMVESQDEFDHESRAPGGSEWRASWEKWTAQMMAAMARQNQFPRAASIEMDRSFIPESTIELKGVLTATPSTSAEAVTESPAAPEPIANRSILRRFGYGPALAHVSEKEVKAYSYRPNSKPDSKIPQKVDRMLVVFWIPILLLAIGWALYSSFPIAMSILKQVLPYDSMPGRFTEVQ